MNPLPLLLLAAAAKGRKSPGAANTAAFDLDIILGQLHGAVNALEIVTELSHMSSSVSKALPSPVSAHTPPSLPPENAEDIKPAPGSSQASSFPDLSNLDLQGAIQTLGPLLSMLGGSQNSR